MTAPYRSVASDETFEEWLRLPEWDKRTIEEYAVEGVLTPVASVAQAERLSAERLSRTITATTTATTLSTGFAGFPPPPPARPPRHESPAVCAVLETMPYGDYAVTTKGCVVTIARKRAR